MSGTIVHCNYHVCVHNNHMIEGRCEAENLQTGWYEDGTGTVICLSQAFRGKEDGKV